MSRQGRSLPTMTRDYIVDVSTILQECVPRSKETKMVGAAIPIYFRCADTASSRQKMEEVMNPLSEVIGFVAELHNEAEESNNTRIRDESKDVVRKLTLIMLRLLEEEVGDGDDFAYVKLNNRWRNGCYQQNILGAIGLKTPKEQVFSRIQAIVDALDFKNDVKTEVSTTTTTTSTATETSKSNLGNTTSLTNGQTTSGNRKRQQNTSNRGNTTSLTNGQTTSGNRKRYQKNGKRKHSTGKLKQKDDTTISPTQTANYPKQRVPKNSLSHSKNVATTSKKKPKLSGTTESSSSKCDSHKSYTTMMSGGNTSRDEIKANADTRITEKSLSTTSHTTAKPHGSVTPPGGLENKSSQSGSTTGRSTLGDSRYQQRTATKQLSNTAVTAKQKKDAADQAATKGKTKEKPNSTSTSQRSRTENEWYFKDGIWDKYLITLEFKHTKDGAYCRDSNCTAPEERPENGNYKRFPDRFESMDAAKAWLRNNDLHPGFLRGTPTVLLWKGEYHYFVQGAVNKPQAIVKEHASKKAKYYVGQKLRMNLVENTYIDCHIDSRRSKYDLEGNHIGRQYWISKGADKWLEESYLTENDQLGSLVSDKVNKTVSIDNSTVIDLEYDLNIDRAVTSEQLDGAVWRVIHDIHQQKIPSGKDKEYIVRSILNRETKLNVHGGGRLFLVSDDARSEPLPLDEMVISNRFKHCEYRARFIDGDRKDDYVSEKLQKNYPNGFHSSVDVKETTEEVMDQLLKAEMRFFNKAGHPCTEADLRLIVCLKVGKMAGTSDAAIAVKLSDIKQEDQKKREQENLRQNSSHGTPADESDHGDGANSGSDIHRNHGGSQHSGSDKPEDKDKEDENEQSGLAVEL